MCSTSLTFEVRLRSNGVTTRFSISSGDSPVYTHSTLTTGMSMYGKMSTGIVVMAALPRIAIRIAITTKVYGRYRLHRRPHQRIPRQILSQLQQRGAVGVDD